MYNKLGPDTGFDSIGEFTTAKAMSNFLNKLNMEGKLTRTILYCLNPCANEVIATMLGNFQDGSCPGKIQFGSGWWFNDQLDGMTRQMNALRKRLPVWWRTSPTIMPATISSFINSRNSC